MEPRNVSFSKEYKVFEDTFGKRRTSKLYCEKKLYLFFIFFLEVSSTGPSRNTRFQDFKR